MRASSVRSATAVIVTIEGFGTNLVGAYGNAIAPTPHLDRFASRSLVADQFWMDGCNPNGLLSSMWSGSHLVDRAGRQDPIGSIDQKSTDAISGMQSSGLLVTDSLEALELGKTLLAGEAVLASPPESGQTAFAALVTQAIEQWIPAMESLPWLWIHSRGLRRAWDAPYEYRCSLCGEEDPLPPQDTSPPSAWIDRDTDPDIVFGWSCGAGAQAMVIDEVWEWMESALEQLGTASTCLLTLAGVLGYPMGEHYRVGYPILAEQIAAPKLSGRLSTRSQAALLHSELLHTPMILRPGDSLPLGVRFAQFLQPQHLGRLVDSWIERDGWPSDLLVPSPSASQELGIEQLVAICSLRRDQWPPSLRAALAIEGQHSALHVPGWGAIWDSSETGDGRQSALFAMPDDRWEQNEIRSRAPEILERMEQLRDEWVADSARSPSNTEAILSRMDESLWRPYR